MAAKQQFQQIMKQRLMGVGQDVQQNVGSNNNDEIEYEEYDDEDDAQSNESEQDDEVEQ